MFVVPLLENLNYAVSRDLHFYFIIFQSKPYVLLQEGIDLTVQRLVIVVEAGG